ncbi:MAG: Gfo/Idh/MocA family protein [Candidatus Zipacnadales bacterium]
MSEPLRLAIIGAGKISQLAHLPAAQMADNVEVVALCDSRVNLLSCVAAQHNIARTYTSITDVLADEAVEAVDLCVPTLVHGALSRQMLAGGKHVLCEKPMASRVPQAVSMLAVARKANCRLMVGHHKRYDPGCEQAREVLRSGAIGSPRLVTYLFGTGNWTAPAPHPTVICADPAGPWEYEYPPGIEQPSLRAYYESLLEMFTHVTNLLRWLIGDPEWLLAAQPTQGPVRGIVSLGWGEEAVETYAFCTDGPHYSANVWNETLTIWGDEGRIELVLSPNVQVNQPARVRLFTAQTGCDTLMPPVYGWAFARQLAHFAACIRTGKPFRTEGEDSIKDIIIAETAVLAAAGLYPLPTRIPYSQAEAIE